MSPLAARLDALEKRVEDLQAAFYGMSSSNERQDYGNKYAVIIGIDRYQENTLPQLRYAASDARGIARILTKYGFTVWTVLDAEATRSEIKKVVDIMKGKAGPDDLVVFYYAGASARSTDLDKTSPERLILSTYDVKVDHVEDNLTLQEIVDDMSTIESKGKLVLIDGCHGTFGLKRIVGEERTVSTASLFQILAAPQDDEVSAEMDSLGGRIFTQTVIRSLVEAESSPDGIGTRQLAADVARRLREYTSGRQNPKLVDPRPGETVFSAICNRCDRPRAETRGSEPVRL